MTHWIKTLQARDEADRLAQADSKVLNREAEVAAAREGLKPLPDRLRALLRTIPPEVAAEGLSLMMLRVLLRGRGGRGCHSGELGEALRALGWTRKRGWGAGAGAGFGASWVPPRG